jgi:hypothetical protein
MAPTPRRGQRLGLDKSREALVLDVMGWFPPPPAPSLRLHCGQARKGGAKEALSPHPSTLLQGVYVRPPREGTIHVHYTTV